MWTLKRQIHYDIAIVSNLEDIYDRNSVSGKIASPVTDSKCKPSTKCVICNQAHKLCQLIVSQVWHTKQKKFTESNVAIALTKSKENRLRS